MVACTGDAAHWLNMPPVPGFEYVVDFWHDIGLAMAGMEPLTYSEIDAWSRATDIPVGPNEVRWLKAMSDAYIVRLIRSRKPDEPAPYDSRSEAERRASTQSKFERLFQQAQSESGAVNG